MSRYLFWSGFFHMMFYRPTALLRISRTAGIEFTPFPSTSAALIISCMVSMCTTTPTDLSADLSWGGNLGIFLFISFCAFQVFLVFYWGQDSEWRHWRCWGGFLLIPRFRFLWVLSARREDDIFRRFLFSRFIFFYPWFISLISFHNVLFYKISLPVLLKLWPFLNRCLINWNIVSYKSNYCKPLIL